MRATILEEEKMCKEQLKKGGGWEETKKILDLTWPDRIYKTTKVAQDRKTMEEGDMILLVEPKTELEPQREVSTRFVDIRPLVKNGIKGVQQMKRTTEMIDENGARKEISNFLWMVPLESSYETETLYKGIEEVRGRITGDEMRNINIIISEKVEERYARKCTEAIFHNTRIPITIWNNKAKNNGNIDQKTEKIIMKTEGKDYASALRSMRKTINLDRLGVKLKNIRKTAQGDVMLEVMGGKEKAPAFKGAIEKEMGGPKVEIRRDTSIIYISDIEADITEDDIRHVIRSNYKKTDGEVLINMRENRNGNKNAMVTLDRDVARDILRKETIKIGWMSCRVRGRISLTRCYKCLDFGHRTIDCKGKDNSNHCLNCNEVGHKAKGCLNERFCNNCNTNGHRADQMACPTFRDEINKRSREIEDARKAKRRPNRRTITRESLAMEDEVFTG